ncbi:MAG: DUF427 domain-containing protein [Bacteroidales bacterium]|nr:DUF427 domain-containing protein [Bacteroidales bacterium]
MKAIWNGAIIAQSNETVNIEGNQYFPPSSVNMQYLSHSELNTVCHWKGTASYYNINIDGNINKDAAWYYPEPSNLAEGIKDYIAFWKGVEISEE